jgi:hypothetical protein
MLIYLVTYLFACAATVAQIAIQRRQVHQVGMVGLGLGTGGISEANASEEGIIDIPPFTTQSAQASKVAVRAGSMPRTRAKSLRRCKGAGSFSAAQ